MLKIKIANLDLIIKIISGSKQEKIEIKKGFFKDEVYFCLTFTDGKLILEGDNLLVLTNKADAVVLEIKTPLEKLAEHFHDSNILIEGISVIPDTKLRESLQIVAS